MAGEVDRWCSIGCWDASTAKHLLAADLTPRQVKEAAKEMAAGQEDYPANDPIYAACNGDLDPERIVEAAKS